MNEKQKYLLLLLVGVLSQYLYSVEKYKHYTELDIEKDLIKLINNTLDINIKDVWENDKTLNRIVIKTISKNTIKHFNLELKYDEIFNTLMQLFHLKK